MQPGDYTQVIYDRGCLRSGEEWVERNLVPVAAVAVALAVLQARTFSPVCRVKKLSNPRGIQTETQYFCNKMFPHISYICKTRYSPVPNKRVYMFIFSRLFFQSTCSY